MPLKKHRSGNGPTLMLCELDRLCSHTSSDDHRVYRPAEEIAEMFDRDPISVLADELIDAGDLTQEDWDNIRQEIDEQVDREYIEAESKEDPVAESVLDQLFAEPDSGQRTSRCRKPTHRRWQKLADGRRRQPSLQIGT